jgi:hypothetical protein
VIYHDGYLERITINGCIQSVPYVLPGDSLGQPKNRTLLSGGLSSVQFSHILYLSLCISWVRNLVRRSPQYHLHSEHPLILMWLVLRFRMFKGFSQYISCLSYLHITGRSTNVKNLYFSCQVIVNHYSSCHISSFFRVT